MTADRWPPPPDGAFVAAVAASRGRRWAEAIDLWRDLFRRREHTQLATACLVEAAEASGRDGLADQMRAQHDGTPVALPDKAEPDAPRVRERLPLLARWRAPKPRHVADEVARWRDKGGEMLRTEVAALMAAGPLSREALHWVILGLDRIGATSGDPLFDEALRRFDAIALPGEGEALSEARLYRGLGYPAFARLLLRAAHDRSTSARERARIRRRLARLAGERDRWLDDADIVEDPDFAGPEAVAARRALRDCPGCEGAPGDPLATATAYLVDCELAETRAYAPTNRLLMVGNSLACGGMERILARSFRHFADSGAFDRVDLALLDFADNAPSAFYAGEAGVAREDVVLLSREGSSRLPLALLPGSWKARAQKLFDHIVETRPRAVHAWNDLTGLLAAHAALLAGCPRIVVHFHHSPAVPLSGRAEPVASYPAAWRRLLERPEIVTLFCAEAAAQGYADWWRVPRSERLRVVYNGLDWPAPVRDKAAARIALGLPAEAPVIGAVMRLAPVKQPLVWAEAAIALAAREPAAHFLIVGAGPERGAIAQSFTAAGLADRVHMPGRVETVAEHLAAMDLFWLTSASEGLPNALIEAQLSGVPAVAFDVGGAGETIVAGESGWLVPPDDVDALVGQSLDLLGAPRRLAGAASAAVAQARTRFSPARFFADLEAAYEN